MPSVAEVNEAKALTKEELNDINFSVTVDEFLEENKNISFPEWDYVWNEASWNASFENGVLKTYYEVYDKLNAPYKEDLWNTVENRAANLSDARKDPETGEYVLDENGNYIYENCVRCWLGALNAPGAQYPWCCVKLPVPFEGTIKFKYDGGEDVFPWGEESRKFGRGFGIASIPAELGEEFLLHDGVTSFDPEKLVVTAIAK